MDKRTKLLNKSTLGLLEGYKPYSVARIALLRDLGNPFFGGEGKDWRGSRTIGTAWVAFTRSVAELKELMAKDDPLAAFDDIWEESLEPDDFERFYKWMLEQSGMTEAAETEAVQESGRGKPVASVETAHTS